MLTEEIQQGMCERIQHHIVDEDDLLFRLVGDRLTREDQDSLGRAMEDAHNP
jgi:hypothetical protein